VSGSGRGMISGTILEFTYRDKENRENFSQDSESAGQELNPGSPKLGTTVLITRWCSSLSELSDSEYSIPTLAKSDIRHGPKPLSSASPACDAVLPLILSFSTATIDKVSCGGIPYISPACVVSRWWAGYADGIIENKERVSSPKDGWRKLYNEELHNLCSSSYSIKPIK
jgi:hypothetical protein